MMNGENIDTMETDEVCKYLDVMQVRKMDHQGMKKELTVKFIKRVRHVLRTHLISNNLFKEHLRLHNTELFIHSELSTGVKLTSRTYNEK